MIIYLGYFKIVNLARATMNKEANVNAPIIMRKFDILFKTFVLLNVI